MKTHSDDIDHELSKFRNISFVIVIILILVYQFNLNNSIFTDALGVIIIGSLSLLLMNFLNFKEILIFNKSNFRLSLPIKRK